MKTIYYLFASLIFYCLCIVSCNKDDVSEGTNAEQDTMPKTFNFEYSEVEKNVRNLPDELHCSPTLISQEDSLYFDQVAQDFLSEIVNTSLSKAGGAFDEQFEDDASDVITSSSHVSNLFDSPYIIEYQHWDAGDWGIAHHGNFETYVKVIQHQDSKVALVILYKPQGFMLDGIAYIKLGSVTYGKVLVKVPFKAKKQSDAGEKVKGNYIVLPYTLDGNNVFGNLPFNKLENNKASFINLCPLIISNNGGRSYDNSIYIQSKNALSSSNISVNGADILPGTKGCEFICAKYINTVFSSNRTEWWPAKNWAQQLSFAEEGFDVYDNDGSQQVREGDILCFAPTNNDNGHVGIVIKIDSKSATIVHTDNNDYIWNVRLAVRNKIVYDETVYGAQSLKGGVCRTITHIIRKNSPYDTKYTEVHSVKPIIIENIQHFEQLKGQCNASAYVIAASTFKHVLGDDSYIANTTKATEVYNHNTKCKDEKGNDIYVMDRMWYACYYYCNTVDKDFLHGEFCSTRPGHTEYDKNCFLKSIIENLDNNRIIIADMRGTFDLKNEVKEWEKDCYYSDDPSINPDLSPNPTYFTKTGYGHVIGIVSIKIDPITGEGIVGYYDTMAAPESRKGVGKNNIRYVSLSNFLISNYNAATDKGPLGYDAYYVGLKDGLEIPPQGNIITNFDISLSKTDDIKVGDKLELIITSNQSTTYEVDVDGVKTTITDNKFTLPTTTAKTYSVKVTAKFSGKSYEKLITYKVTENVYIEPSLTVQLTKTDNISVGDDLELIVSSDKITNFEVEVDGVKYSPISNTNNNRFVMPTSTAKTYSGVVKGTLSGITYEKPFKYTVNSNGNNSSNTELSISFEGKTEVDVEETLYVTIKTTTTCKIEILDDFDDVIDSKSSTTSWPYKVDTKRWGYKELRVRCTDEKTKKQKEATFEYEVSYIQVPNVSKSKSTIDISSVKGYALPITLYPNKYTTPYYKASYVGDGYFRFEKSSGKLNETGRDISILVVEGSSPSDLKDIKSSQIVESSVVEDGITWSELHCFNRKNFSSTKSFYILINDSQTKDGTRVLGYYIGPILLGPIED